MPYVKSIPNYLGKRTASQITALNAAIAAGTASYQSGTYLTLSSSGTDNGTIYNLKGVGTAAVFASVDGGGSAGALGPYADLAALQAAKPATASPGAVAYVGAAAPYSLYDSNGGAWKLRDRSVIGSVGAYKYGGSQSTVQEGIFAGSMWVKLEMEAMVKRVRLWVFSREHSASTGWKFAVAPTDQLLNDTVNNAYLPQIGGVLKNTVAQVSNEHGWRIGTWGGTSAARFGPNDQQLQAITKSGPLYGGCAPRPTYDAYPTDHAIPGFVRSDWLDVATVMPSSTPASGVARPLLLLKVLRTGGTGFSPNAAGTSLSAAQIKGGVDAWTAGTVGARLFFPVGSGNTPAGDWVADPSLLPTQVFNLASSGFGHPYIMLEVEYETAGRNYAFVGESHIEGYFQPLSIATKLSTPAFPVTMPNLGMSSCRSVTFYANYDQYMKGGAQFTDVVFQSHSTNDNAFGQTTGQENYWLNQTFAMLVEQIKDAQAAGKKCWVWTHFFGMGDDVAVNIKPNHTKYIARVKAFCAANNVGVIDLAAQWVSTTHMSNDKTHANSAGIALWKSITEAALRADMGL